MKRKRIISIFLVVVLAIESLLLSACSKNVSIIGDNKEVILKENEYQIYYLNKECTGLKSTIIEYDESDDAVKIAQNCMDEVNKAMLNEKVDSYVELEILSTTLNNRVLSIDFGASYSLLEGYREIMFRACLVLTLTQIEGVDYVGISVNGQSLKDSLGNAVSKMKADDFVNFKDGFPYTTKEVSVVLYYADKTGKMLKKKDVMTKYDYSVSYEEFIVNKLITGISEKDDNYKSTLPKSLVIDMVHTNDGICYIDFDESIEDTIRPVSTELFIYSIVNSLSELSYITKVQFSIEGDNDVKLYGEYDLSTQYSRNLDLVIKEGEFNK